MKSKAKNTKPANPSENAKRLAQYSAPGTVREEVYLSARHPCLLIVESPAKQRTISRFLKTGYVVASSFGHVRDLPEKKLGVDEAKDFEPTYTLLPRTKKILPELKRLAKAAKMVYLATDHDREGESIAWHLVQLLDAESSRFKRITFHEITPGAIRDALQAPRDIDMNLVHAQQARRVLDRLVGYKLSPLLWKKIQRGLSAGRVQSVAVRLLAERAKEIQDFLSEIYWTLTATLCKPDSPPSFEAYLTHWKGQKIEILRTYPLFSEEYRVRVTCFKTKEELEALIRGLDPKGFRVLSVERKDAKRRPPPPFITSTLQQAASQKLGFAAERTMRIAQSLYEGVDIGGDEVGLITYMRTDSLSVASSAQQEARKFLAAHYGQEYIPATPPVYITKVQGAQEAHEAIRPTGVFRSPDQVRKHLALDQAKLYTLIWQRFIASQMVEAVFDTVSTDIQNGEAVFHATGRTLKFDGFLRVYGQEEGVDDDSAKEDKQVSGRLPELSCEDRLHLERYLPEEHKTMPPPHYNEASLIRALEKHGIGRPSTYAPILKTIVDRGYVRRMIKERRLIPTELGVLVLEQLKRHFPDQVSLSYTAQVEEFLDHIAEGKDRWQDVVHNFYKPFANALSKAEKGMEDTRPEPRESDEICPICGSKMLIRESRFGKYLSCSTFPKCKGKIQLNAQGQKIVPELTEEKCQICGKPMVIRMGRKGRFLACSGYPNCKNTYSLDAEGRKIETSRPVVTSRKCNKCSSAFWLRLGKRGYFLACSGFPKCRNIKPVSKEDAEALKAEGKHTGS